MLVRTAARGLVYGVVPEPGSVGGRWARIPRLKYPRSPQGYHTLAHRFSFDLISPSCLFVVQPIALSSTISTGSGKGWQAVIHPTASRNPATIRCHSVDAQPVDNGGSRDLAKQRHAAEALAVSTTVNQPPGSGRHSGRGCKSQLLGAAIIFDVTGTDGLALGLLPTHASPPPLPHLVEFYLPPPLGTIIAVFVLSIHLSVHLVCVLNLLCVVDLHLIRFSLFSIVSTIEVLHTHVH
ncbi:hypothetical protein QBC41DRAFT_3475 [Cercophora samala]|uniref:Uncharacterized protein n=1 Tax=Cercophora samala TaxID=330535 RepID=A0AA40DGU1_9PEZI|nr:hypothetical protein QBC41DRAFT_3475 [Cercophora samala]